MASHHHHDRLHHHNHHETIPHIPTYYATSSSCFCSDTSPCCTQSSPPNLDHLLRLIASYLQTQQQQQQQETQCCCETPSQRLNVMKRQSFVDQQQQKKNVQREYDNLLRKINDLDLSLSRFSSRRGSSYSTLKDSAARVIQTHFRSYLVRRSVSLRQLKELTMIKGSFFSLKSSVSGKTHFPFEAVSREATDLLLQLDSIQGRVDSMIRDGKRTLCRDLVRFLHYVDDCAVKRRNIVSKFAKDVSFTGKCKSSGAKVTEKPKKKLRRIYVSSSGDEENIAELEEFHFMSEDGQEIPIVSFEKSRKLGAFKSRGEDSKVKTPVTKTVKIGKDRNVYELTSSAEDDDSFDDGEEILMMSRDDGVGSSSRSRSRSGVVVKGSGGKTRVVKTVSFDENGNVYKVYGDTPEASGGDGSSISGSSNDENGDGYNEVEDIKYVPKENEGFEEDEEEEDAHSENEEESSSQSSKEESQVTENVSHTGKSEHKREVQLRKGSSMFSPPLPLKMEP